MGNDPKTSAVDRYHRSHDIPNLFVCDGSSLVTSGRGRPTLTIQAWRSARRAHRELRVLGRDLTWVRFQPDQSLAFLRERTTFTQFHNRAPMYDPQVLIRAPGSRQTIPHFWR